MSTALLRRVSRPGLIAAIALVGLGIPSAGTAAAAAQTETVDRIAAFSPGATLKVRNFSGRVTITGTDRRDVSVHAVRGEVASRRLAAIRLRGLRIRRHFHAIHSEARTLSAGARALVAMLVEQAEVSPGRARVAP